ncbi:MAG: hypothetical protein O3C19_04585 [Bacteroidetes bacterium]|nr:hypothetical protein [Bacteroidota bacterium]
MPSDVIDIIKNLYWKLHYTVLYVPVTVTIGAAIILFSLLFILYKYRGSPLVGSLFIGLPLFTAFVRSKFATQPFYEMYQDFADYGVHFQGYIHPEVYYLFMMTMDDWLMAAYWFGAGLSISMGYISFYLIKYIIGKLDFKTICQILLTSLRR